MAAAIFRLMVGSVGSVLLAHPEIGVITATALVAHKCLIMAALRCRIDTQAVWRLSAMRMMSAGCGSIVAQQVLQIAIAPKIVIISFFAAFVIDYVGGIFLGTAHTSRLQQENKTLLAANMHLQESLVAEQNESKARRQERDQEYVKWFDKTAKAAQALSDQKKEYEKIKEENGGFAEQLRQAQQKVIQVTQQKQAIEKEHTQAKEASGKLQQQVQELQQNLKYKQTELAREMRRWDAQDKETRASHEQERAAWQLRLEGVCRGLEQSAASLDKQVS